MPRPCCRPVGHGRRLLCEAGCPLIGWGLVDLSMGRRRAGFAWLALEAVAVAGVTATTVVLADTTWYLVPYILGVAFLVTWAGQAVAAYRRVKSLQGASSPSIR